jgi:hypothetical protein
MSDPGKGAPGKALVSLALLVDAIHNHIIGDV